MADAQGLIVVVSAPSGAGKTTICRRVLAARDDCVFSVSVTTRAPRGKERDGVDYHFINDAEFEARIEQGAFAEWARVHGSYYGTLKADLEAITAAGRNAMLDIDVQGGMQIRNAFPEAVLVFVLPPSYEELKRRLEGRKTEDAAQLETRLRNARDEVARAGEYGYLLVNDDLDTAVAGFGQILDAEARRMPRYAELVKTFIHS